MKITAGLGSIDNYIPYVRAGASEFFCGYVPYEWTRKYGLFSPMNRREVMYYNVQIGSESEMRILSDMVAYYKVPVVLTLNSLSYTPGQYPEIVCYMEKCRSMGFSSFIIADPGLLVYLYEQSLSQRFTIHVSGELGEINAAMLKPLSRYGADRIIFHRKVSIGEIASMIASGKEQKLSLTYEAFVMNEMCHFHGGFCNSLHCDELSHICLLPYQLSYVKKPSDHAISSGLCRSPESISAVPGYRKSSDADRGCPDADSSMTVPPSSCPGQSGCALCQLWQLRQAGISNLKLVSRGADCESTLKDLRALSQALSILENADSEENYIRTMKQTIFPHGCSRNCYYFSLSTDQLRSRSKLPR